MKIDDSRFYNIETDLKHYPEAIIYIVIGGRSTGKTYSSLKYCYSNKRKFIFMKRTNKDVDLLCERLVTGKKKDGEAASLRMDVSPFKSLNRDLGWNVHAFRMYDGFGGFWNCDENDEPVGDPVGYILSFNAISKFKGFDLSDADFILFDEFIPLPYERVNRHEGLELMDLYRTVGRARNILNGENLKLICLANATTVSCPVINDLELSDDLIDMKAKNQSIRYLKNRHILLHEIEDINGFREAEEQNPIYKAMRGTRWAKMSLDNDFAYNDFSYVKPRFNLKGYRPYCKIIRSQKTYYVYSGDSGFYMTYRQQGAEPERVYDLNREGEQKRFYTDEDIDFRIEVNNDHMFFQTYEMYDLIVNFREFYKV